MNKRNITLVYGDIEAEHLGKDVFLAPYYIGKIYDMDTHIVYSKTKTNKNLPKQTRGVKLIALDNIFIQSSREILRGLADIVYVLFNAKKIDLLMRFFCSDISAICGVLYKTLNKHGKLYIKTDARPNTWPLLGYYNSMLADKSGIKQICKKYIYKKFLQNIDLITVETKSVYENICTKMLFDIDLKDKVQLLYSGFDTELFDQYSIQKKQFSEKENIVITVGRLGSIPKNIEMLLEAASKIDYKNWKLVLIGPVEKKEQDFQKKIDAFYSSNPELKDKVIFTGSIYDKEELWNWYNSAKVFVLTSIYESFGIVLNEALFFQNYIVSTEVGASREMIQMGYGEIIPQQDAGYLAKVLQKIIDKNNMLDSLYNNVQWNCNDISWEKYVRDATVNLLIK